MLTELAAENSNIEHVPAGIHASSARLEVAFNDHHKSFGGIHPPNTCKWQQIRLSPAWSYHIRDPLQMFRHPGLRMSYRSHLSSLGWTDWICDRSQTHCDCDARINKLEETIRLEMTEMHETVDELIRTYEQSSERRHYDLLKMVLNYIANSRLVYLLSR